jgi:type I restriction enzyme R subunit
VRIDLDKDVFGWRPPKGMKDKKGNVIEDRIYNQKDMEKVLVIQPRTQLIAQKISGFLKATGRFDKTIVFCEDIDHAERMRQALVNENADLAADNPKYVMRITGDEQVGKAELDNFIDPESTYPVIATTSEPLTTGVDAQTCKLIVLHQSIQSMTKFKQIIGRGTRINEAFDKFYFTIMDFKKATELFADPDFDGEPVQIYNPGPTDPPEPPEPPEGPGEPGPTDIPEPPVGGNGGEGRVKYYIDKVPVWVVRERVQYYGSDGKLITESLKDYTRKALLKEYESLDQFLQTWTDVGQKKQIIEELEKHGVLFEALEDEVGKDLDAFDLICHVAFDQPPLTRRERAEKVRKRNYFTKYGNQTRLVLDALLDKYADEGIENIEDLNILKVPPISHLGTPLEIVQQFGGKERYIAAVRDLSKALYSRAD